MGLLDGLTKKVQKQVTKASLKSTLVKDEDIQQILIDGEILHDVIQQVTPVSPKAVILTNDRILLFSKGLMRTDFKDYYFRDIKDIHYSSTLSGGKLTINADRGNFVGTIVIDKLPLDESKKFYQILQKIEKEWFEKKRAMELEEKTAASGGSKIYISPETNNKKTTDTDIDIEAKLMKLKNMHEKGLLTDDEYNAKKAELLEKL